jgi:hypothetical protein
VKRIFRMLSYVSTVGLNRIFKMSGDVSHVEVVTMVFRTLGSIIMMEMTRMTGCWAI